MRTIGNGNIRRTGAGIAYGTGSDCVQLQDWDLATDDDAATIETANFFDALLNEVNTGDILKARVDLDGTPALRWYIFGNNGTHVSVTLATATAAT